MSAVKEQGSETIEFKNKVALVTGAASGIGRATAIAFAQLGAKVIVADVMEDLGKQTVAKIFEFGGIAEFFKCDVSNDEQVKNMMDFTIDKWGRLDCAFNNAGTEGLPASTTECTLENWDRTININLKGVWLCMKYQLPIMQKLGGGSIVNCSSIAGLVGFAGIPAYVASKHGVIGLTKTAALENAKSNIRINAVCPGVIQTPMIDRFTGGDLKAKENLASGEPIGRVGLPEEIASSVIWLCSDKSSFVTGHSLAVDGGWVAQ